MPQNWWELFPEVVPSPAARPRPLPRPGEILPGARAPSFDASAAIGDSFDQGPYLGNVGQPAMNPGAAIGQAGAAIQAEAAARARMAEMGANGIGLNGRQSLPEEPPAYVPANASFGPFGAAEYDPVPARQDMPAADQAPEDQGGALASLKHGAEAKFMPPRVAGLPDGMSGHNGGGYAGDRGFPIHQPLPLSHPTQSRPTAASIVAGGDPKPPRPRGLPDNVILSSPRTGGPRTPVPHRSYSVRPFHLGGGLNGNGYVPQGGDAPLLARAIYSEFRNTPQDMLAGGWSIVNRVGFRNNGRLAFGHTLTDVVFQPAGRGLHQYSFLNDGGSPAWRESANPARLTGPNQAAWSRAVSIANAILASRTSDPSGGAHYFFASPTYTSGNPYSARPGFPQMISQHHYEPTPYQSGSTYRDRQGLWRNYFFRENPEKIWAPPPARQPSR